MTASVYVAIPHYGDVSPELHHSLVCARGEREDIRIYEQMNGNSLLPHNFNALFCDGYNLREERGLTHFAMHHSDIGAESGWLAKLLDLQQGTGADVVSVTVPIKDQLGLTSTAIRKADCSGDVRRLTMTEIFQLPETFGIADVEALFGLESGSHALLVNTGLWVCDFRRPWVDEFDGFEIISKIVKTPDPCIASGDAAHRQMKRKPVSLPEDWGFSLWCHQRGLQVRATRAVKLGHFGRARYSNEMVWGAWQTEGGEKPAATVKKKRRAKAAA